ncbi:major facilitator superfamily domain-containing protein [Trichoderma longibrachiatum]|uniref:MFS general substrate transporter n=1 Tax=Trichoderma longibrachiatum ATCC 18648 TaxID=983965 RepID=A0A2T4BPM1_TRILO|nr:MFS general substrate transporter [Trichoderma longibrachiatum ATCC 18648]
MASGDVDGYGSRVAGLNSKLQRFWALKRLVNKGQPTTDLDIPLAPWRKGAITCALALAGFMIGVDQSIIEPALPTIIAQFSALHDVGVYTSAYLIPQCVLQPCYNRLYSICSFSSVYISSALTFTAGSIVCALSESSPCFICGRALSGVGAVGLSVGGFRMLALMPGDRKQNVSTGAFSLILGSSVVIGPIIGGVITQSHLGWHWLFWINLPVIGVVLLLVVGTAYTGGSDLRGEKYELKSWEKVKLLDWMGTALLALTLIPLILGLDFGRSYGWGSIRSAVMFAVFGLSFVLLLLQQRLAKTPLFERSILLNRSVWTTTGIFFCALSSMSSITLFLPFLLQVVRELNPRSSGLLSFPLAGTLAVSTFIFSVLSTKVSCFNPLAIAGAAIFLASNILFITLNSDFSLPQIVSYEMIGGLGLGMAWLAEIIFPRAVLDKHQLAMSLGYSRMLQQIGAAVAVQVSAVAFTTSLAHNLAGLPLTPDELLSLQAGKKISGDFSAHTKNAILAAYCKAIRVGLSPAVAWAGLALLFALALPWPSLQRHVADSKEKNNSDSGSESLVLSVLGPSREADSPRDQDSPARGVETV